MSVSDLILNPHNVSISIIIPTIHFDLFSQLYQSLIEHTSNTQDAEIILKLDNDSEFHQFYELCQKGPLKFKLLVYPQYNSRYSLHLFYNDLASIASGRIIWIVNDDVSIIHGDWYKALINTREKYKDNIYCAAISYDNGKGTKQIVPTPAFSREWYSFFGYVTKMPNYDRWLHEMSIAIDRRIEIESRDLLITTPQGHRVLSKHDRKTLFYPILNKAIRKAQRKMKK